MAVSCRCLLHQGLKGGSLQPWSLEIFAVEPGAPSLFLRGAQTKMLIILAKWSPRWQLWSPRAMEHLHFLARSPEALKPFGTLLHNTPVGLN